MNFTRYLKDLELIEKVMLKTYGPNGKTALIQNNNSTLNSFMTTNDGSSLLMSMNFTQNQILLLISNSIKVHAKTNGDQCKSLFVYCFNLLNDLANNFDLDEAQQLTNLLRTQNIYRLISSFLEQWYKNNCLFSIQNVSQFIEYLPKLNVVYDLNTLNKLLSETSSSLALNLVKYFIQNESKLDKIKPALEFINDNFSNLVTYSENTPLVESKFYSNGFFIDKRFIINQPNLTQTEIKALILVKPFDEFNSKSNTIVSLNSNLNTNLSNLMYIGNEQSFSNEFICKLQENKINLILNTGCLTDLQKSQLIGIKCSIISYIEYEYLKFLSQHYGFKLIYMSCLNVNLSDYLIEIDSIQSLNSNNLFYLKLKSTISCGFIHFCSPIKMFYYQFKIYFLKVIKTLLNLFSNSKETFLINSNSFEFVSFKLCRLIQENSIDSQERLFFKFLTRFFDTLVFKFQKSNFSNTKEFLLSKINNLNETNSILYEPFEIKMKCLIESLNVLKHILKIDSICSIRKRVEKLDDSSDSD